MGWFSKKPKEIKKINVKIDCTPVHTTNKCTLFLDNENVGEFEYGIERGKFILEVPGKLRPVVSTYMPELLKEDQKDVPLNVSCKNEGSVNKCVFGYSGGKTLDKFQYGYIDGKFRREFPKSLDPFIDDMMGKIIATPKTITDVREV